MSEREFYLAESDYLDFAIQKLAQNGATIVDALNNQMRVNASKSTDSNLYSSIEFDMVDFKGLRNQARKEKSSASSDLEELSSHLRVVYDDGEKEEFELIVYPYYQKEDISGKHRGEVSFFDSQTTWLALDPDIFYLEEDESGNEIWPVTFPAVSLNDASVEIEVILAKNGKLRWPDEVQKENNRLLYIGTLDILSPDDYRTDYEEKYEDYPGKSKNTNSSAAGVTGVDFLALRSLRLIDIDNSSNAKIQLYLGRGDNYNVKYHRNWTSVFDRRNGYYNRPLWYGLLSDLVFFAEKRILGGHITRNVDGIFDGNMTRSFAIDRHVYETPDVQYPNTNYYFTNMRTWSFIVQGGVQPSYQEVIRQTGFPVAVLTNNYWRFVLVHNKKKYAYTSARRKSTLENSVWTYNMQNGSYSTVTNKMDAASHRYGNSDRVLLNSGVRRITRNNVNTRLNGNSTFTAQNSGGHRYVFEKVNRNAEWVWYN